MTRSVATALALLLLSCGCASRRAAPPPKEAARPPREASPRTPSEVKAALERAKKRTPFIAMPSNEEAHKAMPKLYPKRPMPYLALVGSLLPKSMEAVLTTGATMRREGGLDPYLINDVFWVVSSANECFY